MKESLIEAHPLLYHYTTGAGLQGIVESQQLRATNIAYLNDAEEHTGFFDRRLPYLLSGPVQAAISEIATTAEGRNDIDACEGMEKCVEDLKETLLRELRSHTLKFNNPYITSFCGVPRQDPDDGLLSQWRGYGLDGGYAIVFETKDLHKLLCEDTRVLTINFRFGVMLSITIGILTRKQLILRHWSGKKFF